MRGGRGPFVAGGLPVEFGSFGLTWVEVAPDAGVVVVAGLRLASLSLSGRNTRT